MRKHKNLDMKKALRPSNFLSAFESQSTTIKREFL